MREAEPLVSCFINSITVAHAEAKDCISDESAPTPLNPTKSGAGNKTQRQPAQKLGGDESDNNNTQNAREKALEAAEARKKAVSHVT